MLTNLLADFRIIFERDPAARNWLEVLFCYPGLQALAFHRFSHGLHRLGLPFLPRLLSQLARFLTGIEIHPGAQIGQGVFIDHGMGVVIGETAIIGNYALIYQGVTLGGTGKESGKRHPTLGENVVVGAGAKVLGNIEIGDRVRIGAGSVVLRTVPSDCTVVGVPGRIVHRSGERVDPLEHGRLPDSEAQVIRALVDRIESLEQQIQLLHTKQSLNESLLLVSAVATTANGTNGMKANGTNGTNGNGSYVANQPDVSADETSRSCRIRDKVIEEFLDGSGI